MQFASNNSQLIMRISKAAIEEIAKGAFGVKKRDRDFRAHFGFSSKVVACTWNEMERGQQAKTANLKPMHLLCFLCWVATHAVKEVRSSPTKCNQDSFADWARGAGIAVSNPRNASSVLFVMMNGHMNSVQN